MNYNETNQYGMHSQKKCLLYVVQTTLTSCKAMQQFIVATDIEVNTVQRFRLYSQCPQLVLEHPNASQSHSLTHSQSQRNVSSLTVFESQGPGHSLILSQEQL